MDGKAMMLNMLKRVCQPSEVVVGSDSLRRLQTLPSGRALVFASPSVSALGIADQALELLKKGQLDGDKVIVQSNTPSSESVEELARRASEFQPDWIIGIGGGSLLDACKAAWAAYEHPELDFSCLPPLNVPPLGGKSRFVAAPTTAGSGSEASQVSVLKDLETARLLPYVSPNWIPEIVILDPKLSVAVPAEVTAQTGMDALAHAVESAVSRLAGPMGQLLSATAVRKILVNLPLAWQNGDDIGAREGMLVAAYLAGLSQSAASTGLAHALAHAATAELGIAHGLGTGLFLLPTIRLNRRDSSSQYDFLAREAGLRDADELTLRIEALAATLEFPRSLSDIVTKRIDGDGLARIAENALGDVCLRTNPFRPSHDELVTLLEEVT